MISTRTQLFGLALILVACPPPPPRAPPLAARAPATALQPPAELPALTRERALALRTAPPPESDLPPLAEGDWSLDCGAALELEPGGKLVLYERTGPRRLGGEVVGLPAIDARARRLVFSHAPQARPETEIAAVACSDGAWGEPRSLAPGPGSPDRPAISPDGEQVVWVSGASGLPSLWTVAFTGGELRQISNQGLERATQPGQPPAGFIAPPEQGPARVDPMGQGSYRVSWQGADGEHSVELP